MVARTHPNAREKARKKELGKREGDDTRLSLFYLGRCKFFFFWRGSFVLDCLGTNERAGSIGLLFFVSSMV